MPSHQDIIDAAAGRLVHVWRRLDRLGHLPLTDTDRKEVILQKKLIKAYMLSLDKMKTKSENKPSHDEQAILDDIMSFANEVHKALDEAGITI